MSKKSSGTTTKMRPQRQAGRSGGGNEMPIMRDEELEAAVARLAAYIRKHAVPPMRREPA